MENLLGREGQGFEIITSSKWSRLQFLLIRIAILTSLPLDFNHERLWLACTSLRLARISVQDAFLHANSRETFGKKLIENQVIRAKFSAAGRKIESAHALIEQLVYIVDSAHKRRAPPAPAVGGLAANCKVLAGQVLEHANRESQQIMGGLGYSKNGRGARIEQISRDLRVMVVGGGSEEILADFAIKEEAKLFKAKDGSKL